MVKSISSYIVARLLEMDDFDPKAFARDMDPEFDISQIKSSQPNFFSRASNKHFGTRGWRVVRGNYVIGKYRRRHNSNWGAQSPMVTGYLVYKFQKNSSGSEYDLRYVGDGADLDEVKELIASHRVGRAAPGPPVSRTASRTGHT